MIDVAHGDVQDVGAALNVVLMFASLPQLLDLSLCFGSARATPRVRAVISQAPWLESFQPDLMDRPTFKFR